jgi:hypothetical protein
MSLIHEALKRAEAEKTGREITPPPVPTITPADKPAESPALRVVSATEKNRQKTPLTVTALLMILAAVGVVAYFVFSLPLPHGRKVTQAAKPTQIVAAGATPIGRPEFNIPAAPGASDAVETPSNEQAGYCATQPATFAETSSPSPEAAAPASAFNSSAAPAAQRSMFHLDGIVVGPDGATAIINGQSVTQGQTVDGAQVLRVDEREVVIEYNGRKVTLRM